MEPTRWGIISAELNSNDFCVAIATLLPPEEHQVVAVAATSLEAAEKLAQLHNIQTAYGSYEELIEDPNVDVVYVGSMNPQHLPIAKLALETGKPVLCEKPMCMNVKETKELVSLAREKKLFLMEGVWIRHLPAVRRLKEELDKGTIGDVHQVIASLGKPIPEVDRLRLKHHGAGATLDLGVYCTQFASLAFGGERPEKILAAGALNEDGVDMSASSHLVYSSGRMANLITNPRVYFPCEAIVSGTKGVLKIPHPFWAAEKLETPTETLEFPLPPTDKRLNFENSVGLAYQCEEVRRCLLNGLTESPVISLDESIVLAEITESIRKQVGVVYPQH